MVSRIHRFHGHASLPALYRRSQTVRGNYLSLKYVPRHDNRPYRLAIVVSRKVSKSAVVRNRIRRRLYEYVRLQAATFTADYDMVLLVYSDTLESMATELLQSHCRNLLSKAGIVREDRRAIVNLTGK